jgi:hypothetical protein
LKSGLLERQASAPITFPDAGPGEPVAPVQAGGIDWLPFLAIALAILVVLGTATVMLLARRRRRRREAGAPAAGTRRALRQDSGVGR